MPLYHGCDACQHHAEFTTNGHTDCQCLKGLDDEHSYRCIDSFGLSRARQRKRCLGFEEAPKR